MDMDLEGIKAGFAAFLRDMPRGATADVTEHTVVYWDGEQVMGVHRCADYPGFDKRFELDHHFCGDAHEDLVSWFAHPRYTVRPVSSRGLTGCPTIHIQATDRDGRPVEFTEKESG